MARHPKCLLIGFLLVCIIPSAVNASAISAEKRYQIENELKSLIESQLYIVTIYSEFKEGSKTMKGVQTGFFADSHGYILTAGHGRFNEATKIDVILKSGKRFQARFAGEIQTIDLAVLSMGNSINFSIAQFADIKKLLPKRGEYRKYDDIKGAENDFVVWQCTNRNFELTIDRVYIGEINQWYKDKPEISVFQLQQSMSGCSGAPVLNRFGEIIGMVRSSVGHLVFLIDAESISAGARLIIEEDKKAGQ